MCNGPTKRRSGGDSSLAGGEPSSQEGGDKEATAKAISIRTDAVRNAINREDQRLRKEYWLLSYKWQDTMGALCLLGAALTMLISSSLWWRGSWPTWAMILTNAVAASVAHEFQHDVIHDIYFRTRPWVQHLMFALTWAMKADINPWFWKGLHLQHHRSSGTKLDLEERLLGLGMPWGLRRILITLTPAATTLALDITKDDPDFDMLSALVLNLPVNVSPICLLLLWLINSGNAESLFTAKALAYLTRALPYLTAFGWCIAIPNTVRYVSLTVMTTYSHYYGDLPSDDVYYQTQILDHPALLPLQAFCFNFGGTHGLHHYNVRQPFYLRQMGAFKVLPMMKAMGFPHNDMGLIFRQNSWHTPSKNEQPQ